MHYLGNQVWYFNVAHCALIWLPSCSDKYAHTANDYINHVIFLWTAALLLLTAIALNLVII